MFKNILQSELKNILRNKMYLFFAVFPIILGIVGYFMISYIKEITEPTNPLPEIVATFLILFTSYIFGAITAFTLLDDNDDKVLISLKITPINVSYYIYIKLLISYIFAFIATLTLILSTNLLTNSNILTIIFISLISALQSPLLALIVTSFATNKVEGFVIMKMSGLILFLPILVFFVYTWKEIFLITVPGFWPARLIQIEILPSINTNFTFFAYLIVGILYNLILISLLFKIYKKRTNL